jgi:hypothetical protein
LVGPLLLLRLITGSASTCITVQKLGVVKQCPLGTLVRKGHAGFRPSWQSVLLQLCGCPALHGTFHYENCARALAFSESVCGYLLQHVEGF